jgi:cytochrome b561
MASQNSYDIPIYAPPARGFHWLVAALVILQFPIGWYMMYRSEEMPGVNDKGEPVKGVWDGITDTFFSTHKTIGITIFTLMLLRLAYRLLNGAPRSDPTVPAALTGIGHLTHWALYLLLILVPIGGYIGISYGNYLDVFGVHLPAITAEDKKMSEAFFGYHQIGAIVLFAFAALHILAALFHKLVRKDRVVERMLPRKSRMA